VIALPLAHMGHAVAFAPFFAPPMVLTLGLLFLTLRDRLRGDREVYDPERDGTNRPPAALGGQGTNTPWTTNGRSSPVPKVPSAPGS
jgi:hypothetical protein